MILCSGVFDGLHAGHVAYLTAAMQFKQPGEALVVAVAPDDYVRRTRLREPSWSLADRMLPLEAVRGVDGVLAHGVDGAADAITALEPRLFVKGPDWRASGGVPGDVQDACYLTGALVMFVDHPHRGHTSEVRR